MGQESSQLVEGLKIPVLHGNSVRKGVWAWLLCNLSREEGTARDFLGLSLSQPGRSAWVQLSRLQGQEYASDFMAINLPTATSVLPNLKMC